MSKFDNSYMELALCEAKKGIVKGEVPIGVVIVHEKYGVITKQHNLVESNNDATAHAELLAIKKACKKLKSRYLGKCTLYSTLEPCAMCSYAISLSRMQKLIFGAENKQAITTEDDNEILYKLRSSYIPETYSNIMSRESIDLLQHFFTSIRQCRKKCYRKGN